MSYSQLWDSVTAPAIPADWDADAQLATLSTASAFSSPNALALSGSATTGGRYFATLTSADGNGGDVTVSAYFQWGGTAQSNWGLTARGSATPLNGTSTSCYLCEVITNVPPIPMGGSRISVKLSKLVSGTLTQLAIVNASTPNGGFTAGAWYVLSFTLSGTSLSAQLRRVSDGYYLQTGTTGWANSGAVNCVTATDASIAGAGYCGVAALQGAASQGLLSDNYALSSIAPAASPILPFPRPAYPLLDALGQWPSLPAPSVARLAGLPSLSRVGGLFRHVTAAAPGDDLAAYNPAADLARPIPAPVIFWQPPPPPPPRQGVLSRPPAHPAPRPEESPSVGVPARLPSVGTPTPLSIGPPGLPRPLVGQVDDVPPRVYTPMRLPSVGTPTPLFLPPPGLPLLLMGVTDDVPPRVYTPMRLPSVGVPGSTGPGLVASLHSISRSWLAGGQLGGGGLAGMAPSYGNTSFTAAPANGRWGDIYTGGDAGPGPVGWSLYGALEALPSETTPGGPSSGTFGLGGLCNCCTGGQTICLRDCDGTPVTSATIAVYARPSGDSVGGCITGSDGCCQVSGLTNATTPYTVVVTDSGGIVLFSGPVSLSAGGTPVTLGVGCCTTIRVVGCDGGIFPVSCQPTIGVYCGGTLVYSGMCDATGQVTATLPPGSTDCVAYLSNLPPNYDASIGYPIQCPGTNTIAAQPLSGAFVCCRGILIPPHLTLTDAAGSCAFNYCAAFTGSGVTYGWWGCQPFNVAESAQYSPDCFSGETTYGAGPIAILYYGNCCQIDTGTGQCFVSTGFNSPVGTLIPGFQVTRNWIYNNAFSRVWYLGMPYNMGVQEPPCQPNLSGSWGGAPCSELTWTTTCYPAEGFAYSLSCASDGSAGVAPIPPCEAFALSVPMVYVPGTACGWPTIGDPVGGSITLS